MCEGTQNCHALFSCLRELVLRDSRMQLKADSDVIIVCRFDDYEHSDVTSVASYSSYTDDDDVAGADVDHVSERADDNEEEVWDWPDEDESRDEQFEDSQADTSPSLPSNHTQHSSSLNLVRTNTRYSNISGLFATCKSCQCDLHFRQSDNGGVRVPDRCPECFSEHFRDTFRLRRGVHDWNVVEGQFDSDEVQ